MISTRSIARRLSAGAVLLLAALAACTDSTGSDKKDGPPVLTNLNPSTVLVGSATVTLTLDGQRFTDSTFVRWNGFGMPATLVSRERLQVVIPAGLLTQAGTAQISVVTPGPAGGTSEARTFTVEYPAPALTALSIDTVSAWRADVVVTATGTGFMAATVARWNGAALATTVVSATQLRFTLPQALLTQPGANQVTLQTPAPGGGTTTARAFTVVQPVPTITLLPSTGATAGRSGFTLTLHGAGFMQGSRVLWNGVARDAQFVSSSRLEVGVSATDVAAPATFTVAVSNPGVAAPSNSVTFTARALPAATSTTTHVPLAGATDVAWDAGTGRLYVSVRSSGGVLGNTVAAVDPGTGTVAGSVFVGSEPGWLARSDDGRYLYVGLDGASAVRRVNLGTFTAGLQWSLGAGEVAGDLAVMPGHAGTVAVSRHSRGINPPLVGVTIYDDGVARPTSSSGHTGGARIEWLESPDAFYGYNNAHTGFEFFTIGVDAAGARHLTTNGGLISGFYTDIVGAAGRIYGTDGSVVDAERRVRLGSFTADGPLAVDPQTGRIFVPRSGGVQVYDMNTFQYLGAIPISGGIPADYYTTPRIVRFGTDGLALVAFNELILVRSPLIAP
jgi:hypothetical protein